jgi:hypothetical protein
VRTETVTAREYGNACGQLYDSVVTTGGTTAQLVHIDQPVLNSAVGAARKRPLGEAWAWARRQGGDICSLVAVTLARYGLAKEGDTDFKIY